MSRQYVPADYNALKTAMKLVITDLGGIDAAASCTRVGRSQINEYGTAGKDSFAPADVITVTINIMTTLGNKYSHSS
jgi:hypothetical protein